MTRVRFTRRIAIRGINPYLVVSAREASRVKSGWRRPLPVLVTIDGEPQQPARVNLMPAGDGSFYLYLNGPLRAASGSAVGDRVTAELAFDATYRGGPAHRMPASLRAALRAEAKLSHAWKALTPSRRKEILRYLATLRSDAARERNVVKVLAMLKSPRGSFLGRAK